MSLRDGCVIDWARRLCELPRQGGGLELAEVLARLDGLRALLAEGEGRDLGGTSATRAFERLAAAFVESERKRAADATGEALGKVLERVRGDDLVAAHAILDEHKGRLAVLPDDIRAPASEEYRARLAALAEGLYLPGDEAEGTKLFFGLEGILDAALLAVETALADLGATARELASLRQKALTVQEALAKPAGFAVETIDAYIKEVGALDGLYQANRKAASEGNQAAFVIAAAMRAAMCPHDVRFRAEGVKADPDGIDVGLTIGGVQVTLSAREPSYGKRMYVLARGYRFAVPWTRAVRTGLLHAADLAARMRKAGVAPGLFDEWQVVEGPSFPMAVAGGLYFVEGELCRAETTMEESRRPVEEFTAAAGELAEAIRADEGVPLEFRQALVPVVECSFGKTDERDMLDPGFCRRIVAQGYLEERIPAIGQRHGRLLTRYREALRRLGSPAPAFVLRLRAGVTYSALRSVDSEIGRAGAGSAGSDGLPPDAGDDRPPIYSWRKTDPAAGTTSFIMPLPGRAIYSVCHCSTYRGVHGTPPGRTAPLRIAMIHTVAGTIATFDPSSGRFDGDAKTWKDAVSGDIAGYGIPAWGEPGWAFPPHVPVLEGGGSSAAGQTGAVVGLATPQGVVGSPDFREVEAGPARQTAMDGYIDACARLMPTPGELGLFFRYFTQYCLDSPVPGAPTLLGNHTAQGEVHQTVHEFLERKIGGKFGGDCDDVAEFFQVVTRRQGKLSHVFSLPGHAACGYVEKEEAAEGGKPRYKLVFLQTGPTVIFQGETLDEVVEKGIDHFSDEEHLPYTVASVPFLFRFAGEKTRTTYWLSDRILVDAPYAELMIEVQSYWHYHYYATAIRVMEELLETDKDISNFTELAGLYRTVHLYDRAIEMSRGGLAATERKDEKVRLNEIVDIAALHHAAKEDEMAALVLAEVAAVSGAHAKAGRYEEVLRLMPIRLEAASLYAAMKQPFDAFDLLQTDIRASLGMQGKLSEALLATTLGVCGRIREMENGGEQLTGRQKAVRDGLLDILRGQFASKVFEEDDSFNDLVKKYSLLGRLAVALHGEAALRRRLLEDGPYPTGPRDHVHRGRDITAEDWAWIRICPSLYWGQVARLLDRKEPDSYDPDAAMRIAEAMLRGVEAGRRLGSMNMSEGLVFSARIARAMHANDLDEFARILASVRATASDRQTDDAADEFGTRAGFIPLEDFPGWMDAFHEQITDRQHYFKIAHRALANEYHEHALAAAERTAGYFPDDERVAEETVYMKGLSARLKEQAAEIDRMTALRDRWKPLNDSALSLAGAGNLDEAQRVGRQALEVAEKLGEGHPAVVMTLTLLTEIEAARGRFDESIELFRRVPELWRRQGCLDLASMSAFLKRTEKAFVDAGRTEGARELFLAGVSFARLSAAAQASSGRDEESADLAIALFNAADFLSSVGEWPKAAEMFQEALEVDARAYGPDHPEVAVDAERLAAAYVNMDRLAEAEPLYQRVIAIRQAALGPGDRTLLEPLRRLAEVHRRLDRFEDAVADLQRAGRVATGAFGVESAEVAAVLSELADLYSARGDWSKAEGYCRRALRTAERVTGGGSAATGIYVFRLAKTLVAQDRNEEAEALFRRVLLIDEKVHGSDHVEVAADLAALGDALDAQGKHAEAEAVYARALGIREKTYGPESAELLTSIYNLADALGPQGKYADAEALVRRACGIAERTLGLDHATTGLGVFRLARLASAQGRHADAEALFRRALTIDEKVFGPDGYDVAIDLTNIASEVEEQWRSGEAEPLRERALAIIERLKGPEDIEAAAGLLGLGRLRRSLGRPAEAEPLLRRALAAAEKAGGAEEPSLVGYVSSLAETLRDLARFDEAADLHERAVALAEKAHDADGATAMPAGRQVARCLGGLAEACLGQGRLDEADAALRRALAMAGRVGDVSAPLEENLLATGARVALARGRGGEAVELARRAFALTEKRLGPDDPTVAVRLAVLAEVYRNIRQPSRAEPHYRRAVAIVRKVPASGRRLFTKEIGGYAEFLRAAGRTGEADEVGGLLAPGGERPQR